MRIPHHVFLQTLAVIGALTAGLILLVWVARRPAGIALAVVVPPALAGAFIGLTATRGIPLTWEERVRGALVLAAMFSAWLLPAAVVVAVLRRRATPRVIQAGAGALVLGAAYLATRAVVG